MYSASAEHKPIGVSCGGTISFMHQGDAVFLRITSLSNRAGCVHNQGNAPAGWRPLQCQDEEPHGDCKSAVAKPTLQSKSPGYQACWQWHSCLRSEELRKRTAQDVDFWCANDPGLASIIVQPWRSSDCKQSIAKLCITTLSGRCCTPLTAAQ